MTGQVRDIQQQYWRHPQLPHFELRYSEHSLQPYKAHSHPEFCIGLITAGATRLSLGGQRYLLQPGELVLIEPGLVHACNPLPDLPRSFFMLYIDAQWCLERLSQQLGIPVLRFCCEPRVVRLAESEALFARLAQQLQQHNVAEAGQTFTQLSTSILCHSCLPAGGRVEPGLLAQRIRTRLLLDLAAPPSLAQLSEELGRSQEGIIRLFSQHFGTSPKAFVTNARIERAKGYLRAGMAIVDVATQLGFADQSQFHRAFVSHTAATPGQYQQARSIFDNTD
ncbi:helix-turn-helix transcriptional regulator [Balneatrix alpica]|uniref:helix-turn-helix transcriptional regulator n=1 Tax=Balneatrix alpica TaxID=75684 RepID=UPI0027390455|nr:AraC family transcriptional regulator [Balneatrix alpica]